MTFGSVRACIAGRFTVNPGGMTWAEPNMAKNTRLFHTAFQKRVDRMSSVSRWTKFSSPTKLVSGCSGDSLVSEIHTVYTTG